LPQARLVENATGPYRKPRPDMYTALLAIALVAILLAILALWLEMSVYNFEFKGGPPVPPVTWVPAPGPAIAVMGQLPAAAGAIVEDGRRT